jgi:ParB family chromosome partitioning protein
MDIETLPTESLIPYARNARTHSAAQVSQIAASIREFGWTNPVLIDDDGGIIAGHGRVMAARKLGMAEVPCIRLSHLTDTQRRAYIIADNKLALNAGWDDDMLRIELSDLDGFDIDAIGWNEEEMAEFQFIASASSLSSAVQELMNPSQEKEPPKVKTCPHCGGTI